MSIGLGIFIGNRNKGMRFPAHEGPALSPLMVMAPRITGQPKAGKVLTVNRGTWNPRGGGALSYAYQWLNGGTPIGGATATTYTVQEGDIGDYISCIVEVTSQFGGTSEAETAAVLITAAEAPVSLKLPAASSAPVVGLQFTMNLGSWNDGGASPVSYAYQWLKNGTEISGATAVTYTPVSNDEGAYLNLRVAATNSVGTTTVTSYPTLPVEGAATLPVAREFPLFPLVTGIARSGSTLGVSLGEWNNKTAPISFTYQWYADGVLLSGENTSQLVLTGTHIGKYITAKVRGTNFLGFTEYTTVVAHGPVAEADHPAVVVPPQVVANPDGSVEVIPGEYDGITEEEEPTYQWYDQNGDPIPGATSPDYEPEDPEDVGGVIITLPGDDGDTVITIPYTPQPGTSPVLLAPGLLSGIRTVGQTLTYSPAIIDPRGADSYVETIEWVYVDGTPVEGTPDGNTYELGAGDVWKGVRVRQTGTSDHGEVVTLSNIIGPTRPLPAKPVNVVAPGVSGNFRVGQTVTAGVGEWEDYDTDATTAPTFTYQWKANGSNISGATSASYELTSGELNDVVLCAITATNVGGSTTVNTPAHTVTAAIPAIPVNSALPEITGDLEIGATLTVSTGTWTNSPSGYHYSWYADGKLIPGATGNTLELLPVHGSKVIKAGVVAYNEGGDDGVFTAETEPVEDIAPVNDLPPSILGYVVVGQTLTATQGAWIENGSPITGYSYQWYRDEALIAGATNSSYVLTVPDLAKEIMVEVTARHPTGNVTVGSDPTPPVIASFQNPVNTVLPEITGTPRAGAELEVSDGSWETFGYDILSYQYQWRRNGAALSGEIGSVYEPVAEDEDMQITCTVTVHTAVGYQVATSLAVIGGPPLVIPVNTVPPVVSGDVVVGATLSSTSGTWTGADTLNYQWFYSGEDSPDHGDWSPIFEAVSDEYMISEDYVGFYIKCGVQGVSDDGETWAYSNFVGPIETAMEAETALYIAAMTNPPNSTYVAAYDAMVVALKGAGLWDKLDIIGLHANHDAQAATLNLKDPDHALTLEDATSKISFTAGQGYTRTSDTSIVGRLNWGARNTWPSSNFSLNGNCAGVYNRTASLSLNGHPFGFKAGQYKLLQISVANYFNWNNNSASSNNDTTGVTPHNGLLALVRNTASRATFWRNKTKLSDNGSYSAVGVQEASGDFTIFHANASSTDQYHSNCQIALSFAGGALSDSEYQQFSDIVAAYMTAVGA